MTDCGNAEIRDLLPDLVNETLSTTEAARVQAHVDDCAECADEVVLLRTARAVRPSAVSIDVGRIVRHLPRAATTVPLVRSTPATVSRTARGWGSRSVWRAAATIGVMIVGGWSVLIVRSGGLGLVATGRVDSTQLSDLPVGVSAPAVPPTTASPTTPSTTPSTTANDRNTAVSFGGMTDYTDEELQRVLDRLDQWDGATSTETMTTTPILPVNRGGIPE
jgi:hypothetical protein